MIGLFAALSLAASVSPAPAPAPLKPLGEDPFFNSPQVICFGYSSASFETADPKFALLGKLPDANMEIAVSRVRRNGCPLPPVIVSYNVGH